MQVIQNLASSYPYPVLLQLLCLCCRVSDIHVLQKIKRILLVNLAFGLDIEKLTSKTVIPQIYCYLGSTPQLGSIFSFTPSEF